MATRFYLHAAASAVGGTLPSSKRSTMTATSTFDAYSVNRVMDTSVGAAQTDITATKTNAGTPRMYMTRFISPNIDQTSIAANTWTMNIAAWASSSLPYYPASGSSGYIPACLYVWRPSTGAVVGNIFDGLSATGTANTGSSTEKSNKVTYTGSTLAITGGDCLVLEGWTATASTTSYTWHYAFDGTTVNTNDNAAVSNHASYIETPETLVFGLGGITATSTGKVNTNKIIVKG